MDKTQDIEPTARLPVDTIAQRWGEAADAGFTPVPNILVRGQAKLKLSATEMIVLLNLLSHWWYSERMPYPSTEAIAKRSGLSARTVQRSLKGLRKKGLLEIYRERTRLVRNRYEKQRAKYDLRPLRDVLAQLARNDFWNRPDVVRQHPRDSSEGQVQASKT